jgi:hypothetical protein
MRTDFLIHWTGHDIATNRYLMNDAQRGEYVTRLADILERGFWMTQPPEKIYGANESWIKYDAPMTCFTEIRLSDAEIHTQRYGLLGIAVNRHFVLERLGGPVHYVRNHCTEAVIGNTKALLDAIKTHSNKDLFSFFSVNCAFLKAMSEKNTDNFVYLDEQEWRIVHTYGQVQLKNIHETGHERPKYRIPIMPDDIHLIVFPDDRTRTLALEDPRLVVLRQGGKVTPLLTVEECGHF